MLDFVLISTPRSGTNVLRDTLNQHPRIKLHNEVFNTQHNRFRTPPTAEAYYRQLRETHDRDDEGKLLGVTLFCNHDHSGYPEGCIRSLPPTKVIWLERLNVLEQYVSRWRANTHRQWFITDPKDRIDYEPFSVNPQDYLSFLKEMQRSKGRAAKRVEKMPRLAFVYEHIKDDIKTACERVFIFLGLEVVPVTVRLCRQSSYGHISEVVSNYADLTNMVLKLDRPVMPPT